MELFGTLLQIGIGKQGKVTSEESIKLTATLECTNAFTGNLDPEHEFTMADKMMHGEEFTSSTVNSLTSPRY